MNLSINPTRYILGAVIALMLVGAFAVPLSRVHAQTLSASSGQIQALQATIERLQRIIEMLMQIRELQATIGDLQNGEVEDGGSYSINDVESVTVEYHTSNFDGDPDRYTIELENGDEHVVYAYGNAPESAFHDDIRDTGYTGDIDDLLDMVEEEESDDSFDLDDVSSVTVDESKTYIDGPYLYVVTLKSGGKIEISACSNCTASSFEQAFRDAGYVGDVDDLIDMVTEEEKDASATVDSKTYTTENPTVTGTATGVDKLGISIDNGDKVYGSGSTIRVVDGRWSHKVSTDLAEGKYRVSAYSITNEFLGSGNILVEKQIDSGSEGTLKILHHAGESRTIAAEGTVQLPSDVSTPCGPITVGTISWGDGTTSKISGLGCSSASQAYNVEHTYSTTGTYTVKLLDYSSDLIDQESASVAG